jgi:flagellar biosynthesis protein
VSEHDKKIQVAVALDYEIGTRTAPTVVAKGRGLVAEQIMQVARENGIVIEANPMLADALSGVPLDHSIPRELYQAVAEVIGFVLKSRRKP